MQYVMAIFKGRHSSIIATFTDGKIIINDAKVKWKEYITIKYNLTANFTVK